MNSQAERLAELVLIYFTKEELHPDEEAETKKEMLELARAVEDSTVCPDCNGTRERPPDGVDSMGLPRWGHEMEDNRDRRCFTCRGRGTVPKE